MAYTHKNKSVVLVIVDRNRLCNDDLEKYFFTSSFPFDFVDTSHTNEGSRHSAVIMILHAVLVIGPTSSIIANKAPEDE